jgi:hypothetical protein
VREGVGGGGRFVLESQLCPIRLSFLS